MSGPFIFVVRRKTIKYVDDSGKVRVVRRSDAVAELSRLSRNGWQGARSQDYRPLERALVAMDETGTGAHPVIRPRRP